MLSLMRADEWIQLITFAVFAILAWIRPLRWRARAGATAFGTAGVCAVLGIYHSSGFVGTRVTSVLRDWIPALLMLFVYWQAGQFRSTPDRAFEAWLLRLDKRFFPGLTNSRPWLRGLVGGYFELAYLFCYPLVPLGIGVLYATHHRDGVGAYWLAVLPATYLCYVLLPFMQALPPRLLAPEDDSAGATGWIRTLNLWVLRRASIQVNTFPSAHVASTMAASFVLLRLVPVVGAGFLAVAISIAVGAIAGRYHYAIDVFAATAISATVFLVGTFMGV
jgi:hypothetical protein